MKKLLLLFVVATFVATSFSFILPGEPWNIPDSYLKLKNPVKADAASIKAGRELYTNHCQSCHGVIGKGDGTKGAHLDTAPADFTSVTFQSQPDGALFYKIYFGHKDMPAFKKRIPDNEDVIDGSFGQTRGPADLVNYLRTLAKQ